MKITLGNWLYNAGIVGFLKILEPCLSKEEFESSISGNSFNLESKHLKNFAKSYAFFVLQKKNIFLMLYQRQKDKQGKIDKENKFLGSFFDFPVQQEIADRYNRKLLNKIKLEMEVTEIQKLMEMSFREYFDELDSKIRQQFNDLENRIELCNNKLEKRELEKKLKKVNKSLQKYDKSKWKEIEKATIEQHKNFYVIFNYLKQFYNNLRIIGQSSLENFKNRIDGFQGHFVKPAVDVLNEFSSTESLDLFSGLDEDTNQFTCKFCNQNKIKDVNQIFREKNFSITGVSEATFTNFFYNCNSDLFICDMCKLLLLCAFAGFSHKPSYLFFKDSDTATYIFVNLPSLSLMFQENKKIEAKYSIANDRPKDSIYEEVIKDIVLEETIQKSKWLLQNISFIEIRPEYNKAQNKPIFKNYPLTHGQAELFVDKYFQNAIKFIHGIIEIQKDKQNRYRFYLKSEIIKSLLRNDNLYKLAYMSLKQSLEKNQSNDNARNISIIQSIRKQIYKKYKGGNSMESKQVYGILKGFHETGKGSFEKMNYKKKERFSYRLISLIRMGKYNEFYEAIMRLYINESRSIPDRLLDLLNPESEIDFESKAYAFMSGFLTKPEETNLKANNKMEVKNE